LLNSLADLKGKKTLLITHSGCDVDAIGAAGAILFSMQKNNSARIIVPSHMALPAQRLAKQMRIPFSVNKGAGLPQADALFLIDFNSLSLAGNLAGAITAFPGKKFLIDHHAPSAEKIAPKENTLIDENAASSCELVFEILKKSGIPLSKQAGACMACGIIADSAHFMAASSGTFRTMAETMRASGKSFPELLALFNSKKGFDEKIAALKAAKRARIFRLGDCIAATARIGAFEADAASTLVKIGADMAFTGDSGKQGIRISGRASQAALRETGIDLAKDVFQQLPQFYGGDGGGHPGAAGYNGPEGNIEEALSKCVQLALDFLKRKKQGAELSEYK